MTLITSKPVIRLSLGRTQRKFTRLIAQLIVWVYDSLPGHELSFAWAYRPEWVQDELYRTGRSSVRYGLHQMRLAVDLNLFIDGRYQTTTTAHKVIGEHWEAMHPDHRWGGRFNDGNHYSRTFAGLS